jgi:hypothetical protein
MTERPPCEARPNELGEDTMELELTAEEELQFAREAQAVDAQGPSHPDYETYLRTRTSRIDLAGTVTFAALVLAGLSFAGWRALRDSPAPAALTYQSPAVTPVVPTALPQPSFVRVVNPFDAGEMFELPADMTEAETRDAVAEVLLSRARERLHSQSGRRTRASPLVAGAPTDVVVTHVPGPPAQSQIN